MGEPWLKPCPFCGSEKVGVTEALGAYWMRCQCGASGPTGEHETPEAAIEEWNHRPAPQPDKALVEEIDEILHKEAGLYQHIGSSGILAVSQLLARRLAERFGGWVNVPIVRLGKLKVFQHPGEGILVNSIDVIDECRRQGVLATLDDGKSDAQIYEDHGKTVSLKVTEVR